MWKVCPFSKFNFEFRCLSSHEYRVVVEVRIGVSFASHVTSRISVWPSAREERRVPRDLNDVISQRTLPLTAIRGGRRSITTSTWANNKRAARQPIDSSTRDHIDLQQHQQHQSLNILLVAVHHPTSYNCRSLCSTAICSTCEICRYLSR